MYRILVIDKDPLRKEFYTQVFSLLDLQFFIHNGVDERDPSRNLTIFLIDDLKPDFVLIETTAFPELKNDEFYQEIMKRPNIHFLHREGENWPGENFVYPLNPEVFLQVIRKKLHG